MNQQAQDMPIKIVYFQDMEKMCHSKIYGNYLESISSTCNTDLELKYGKLF